MERAITGFHQDDVGDWVAELECGHNQHVRHRPPFQVREWVMDDAERRARIGAPLDCPLCDRAELPAFVKHARDSAVWTAQTMPAGLRRRHRLGRGTWGVLHVDSGALRFGDAEIEAGSTRVIPPDVEHEVEPLGEARFWIEFFNVDRTVEPPAVTPERPPPTRPEPAVAVAYEEEGGGDPACWADLLCPECGAVLDGGSHKDGCPAAP